MGRDTFIHWCDSTVNPTTGCDGCELFHPVTQSGTCYAAKIHVERLHPALPNTYGPKFTDVRMVPGRMAAAARMSDLRGVVRPDKPWVPPAMPRMIFVDDMGDLFSHAITFEFIHSEVVAAARSPKGSRHVYLVLTKRPARLASFARWMRDERGESWPDNVWVGTSVTNPGTALRVGQLCAVPARVRFLSLEPLWDSPCWQHDYIPGIGHVGAGRSWAEAIQWVIVGGESRQPPHDPHPCDLDWIRKEIDFGSKRGIPVFVKQLGAAANSVFEGIAGRYLNVNPDAAGWVSRRLRDGSGADWSEWPVDVRVRDFPPPSLWGVGPRTVNLFGE